MATTTNYGWTTPDDTALVKDGAAAIRSLGSSIDTSLNTALGTKKAGMVLLNTTSFSGSSAQSINDVFSSTYTNYRVVLRLSTTSTGSAPAFRFRVSGADDSNAVYSNRTIQYQASSIAAYNNTTVSYGAMGDYPSSGYSGIILDIFNANAAAPKIVQLTGLSSSTFWVAGGWAFTNSTAFTGFTVYPLAGTFTGDVSTYGYNK